MKNLVLRIALVLCSLGAVATMQREARAFEISTDMPPELRSLFVSDLEYLDKIQGNGSASPLHREIFGELAVASYRRFLESKIVSVDTNGCYGMAICFYPSSPQNFFLNSEIYPKLNTPMGRISSLLGVARLTDSKWMFDQVACPTPFNDNQGKPLVDSIGAALAGRDASCEKTELGDYGTSVVFLTNLARNCVSCTSEEREAAQVLATQLSYRVIDPAARARLLAD